MASKNPATKAVPKGKGVSQKAKAKPAAKRAAQASARTIELRGPDLSDPEDSRLFEATFALAR